MVAVPKKKIFKKYKKYRMHNLVQKTKLNLISEKFTNFTKDKSNFNLF